MMMHNVNNNQV